MKRINISTLILLIIIGFTSCSTIKSLPNGKTIDKRLVGTWAGSEKDQQIKGLSKEWEMLRKEDGTFVLDFKAIAPEETQEFTEKGTWWIEQDKFFEYHTESDKTDTYKFEVLNKNEIKFEMLNTDIHFENPNYTFIDKRKVLTNKKVKDGSSIANAIKVKSVPDEYAYVRKNCEGCLLIGQALLFENKKPYDRINVKTKDGKEKSYYFDISSFYGKF